MSKIIKCFLAIFVVFCFMELFEAARIPRDDAAASSGNVDLSKSLNDIINAMKGAFNDENIQKVLAAIPDRAADVRQQMADAIKNIGEGINNLGTPAKA